MKLSIISAAVALAMGAASFQASAANDGTIDIKGKITATTCLVEGQQPGSDLADKNVDLGDVPASKLAAAGDTSSPVGSTITVGGPNDTGCTNGDTAFVQFDTTSASIDQATGRLNINPGAGSASNVQIQVLNQDGSEINTYTDKSHGVVIANNTAVIPLAAQYIATGSATPGDANSQVGYQVVYN